MSLEQLLTGVRDCVAQITIANGYNTDLGTVVTMEPDEIDPDGETLAMGVLIDELAPTTAAAARGKRTTTVLVAFRVPTGIKNGQAKLREAIADIDRAMKFNPDTTAKNFPPGMQFPNFSGMRPSPPSKTKKSIGGVFKFTSDVPTT